jgi:molybdenum cofactor biosynthesis protein B
MVDFQSRDNRPGAPAGDSGDDVGDEADPGGEAEGDDAVAPDGPVGFAVVTVDTGRTIEEDGAGSAVLEALEGSGEVITREVIDDRYDGVQNVVGTLVERGDVDVVLTLGGTGVEPADVTIEAVEPMLDKRLPGVGEVVRRHCVEEWGTAPIRSRATGGVIDGVPLFCLPGDPDMARTATREVVVPQAEPMARLAAVETD